ncbi:hypothetical protein [Alicyclobacillus macrosporangiidus]|uniref:Uncharacterized protein n=1 Tax=Alicyclobacillus macrosporangiidus TaxID=392015 RepID=A0A1I7GCM9_9BACL|nr:hypothetical protein [Alicyclobacillus macrosporangiidus]SFU46183.1 hypothetical protein SAMN05421543_102135 [Alicyclobacillus macrosporangiidus]
MRQIPSTVVACALLIIFASWPTVRTWAELGMIQHYLTHALYGLAGVLFGLQTAWWAHASDVIAQPEERGISS